MDVLHFFNSLFHHLSIFLRRSTNRIMSGFSLLWGCLAIHDTQITHELYNQYRNQKISVEVDFGSLTLSVSHLYHIIDQMVETYATTEKGTDGADDFSAVEWFKRSETECPAVGYVLHVTINWCSFNGKKTSRMSLWTRRRRCSITLIPWKTCCQIQRRSPLRTLN